MHGDRTARGRHVHIRAQRRLPRGDGKVGFDVRAIQSVPLAVFHAQRDQQIAVLPVRTGPACAGNPQLLTVEGASGDVDDVFSRPTERRSDLHGALPAPVGLFDGEFQLGGVVHSSAEAAEAAEAPAEQILPVHILGTRPTASVPGAAAATRARSGMRGIGGGVLAEVLPEPVVLGAGLRVREHIVGLADALEGLLRARRLVDVRMEFAGLLPVCAADLFLVCRPRDPQGAVQVVRHGLAPVRKASDDHRSGAKHAFSCAEPRPSDGDNGARGHLGIFDH